MKKNSKETENKPADEQIVIVDECGDSMWDAVLGQQAKACEAKAVSKNVAPLLNNIDAVQVSDTTKAK